MARLKRSSNVVEKGMRRLAGMRSLNNPLEVGYGLSLTEYGARIQALQEYLASHNTMLSTVDEMAGTVQLMEQKLRSYLEKSRKATYATAAAALGLAARRPSSI
ncbi:MAG: hypothetical protein KME42_06910 [Tildeniella nuda ZEHNDER 1965/U140]|jgi:hypothetical protein|nr:hypothetical protein [Tildeniella nuda ZEHNDER 1965/U140]